MKEEQNYFYLAWLLSLIFVFNLRTYECVTTDALVVVNNSYTFTCSYAHLIPVPQNQTDPTLMLQKNGNILLALRIYHNETVNKVIFDPRFRLSGNTKSIHFTLNSIQLQDEAFYTCVTNTSSGISIHESVNLSVLDVPELTLKPDQDRYTLYNGDTLSLQCVVTRFQQDVQQFWQISDGTMQPGPNLTLFITYSTRKLTCSATNKAGRSTRTVQIEVQAIEPSKPLNLNITSRAQESSFQESFVLHWDQSTHVGKSDINKYMVLLDGVSYKNVSGSELMAKFVSVNIYDQHTFSVAACNQNGCSEFATKTVNSAPIVNVTAVETTAKSMKIEFMHENNLQNMTFLKICIESAGSLCNENGVNACRNVTGDFVLFDNLMSYCTYSFTGYYKVSLEGRQLELKTRKVDIKTKESSPAAVSELFVQYDDDRFDILQVIWKRPKYLNDKEVQYHISHVEGGVDNFLNTNVVSKITDQLDKNLAYEIYNLKPYTWYTIKLKVVNSVGSKVSEKLVRTDEKVPLAPINLSKISSSSTNIKVRWDAPQKEPPTLEYQTHAVSEHGIHPGVLTEKLVAEFRGLKPGKNYTVKVKSISTKSRTGQKIESPFTSAWYLTDMEATTADAEEDTLLIIVTCVMLILVIVVLVWAMCYCQRKSMFFNRRATFSLAGAEELQLTSPVTRGLRLSIRRAELKSQPMALDEFEKHVAELHVNSDYLFAEEFSSLGPTHPDKTEVTYEHSKTEVNRAKNRYQDIVAYDQSRVRLMSLEGVLGSNYINANYVDGYKKPNAYIATQAPLTHTLGDFWRMIWERKSHIVIMLTRLVERGKRKCDQYWPNSGIETYKNYTVKLVETSPYANYTVRHLRVTRRPSSPDEEEKKPDEEDKDLEWRDVWQYHFEEWPDFGTPLDRGSVISFIQHCRKHEIDHPGPPVVHCSAGVGRTGTYIMLDSLMSRYDDKKEVEVYYFLKKLRKQRNYLVQQECQYIFVHDALLDYMRAGLTTISVEELEKTINCKEFFDKIEYEWTLLEKNTIASHLQLTCKRPYNLDKNRNQAIVPVDNYRVRLTMKAGVEGSDYINASFVDSFQHREAFIITQQPLEATIADFWRMVWQSNSLIVINLVHQDEIEGSIDYIPKEFEETYGGRFYVKIEGERIENNYVCRTLVLRDENARDDQYNANERQVFHYHFNQWQDDFFPRNAFLFELLMDVAECHKKVRNIHPLRRSFIHTRDPEPPITIHCSCGSGRSGLFAALLNFKEQLENGYKKVDVYGTIKSMILRRSTMIQSKAQYEFLYKALLALRLYMESNKPQTLLVPGSG